MADPELWPQRPSEYTEQKISELKNAVQMQFGGEIVGCLFVFMRSGTVKGPDGLEQKASQTVILDEIPEENATAANALRIISDVSGWLNGGFADE